MYKNFNLTDEERQQIMESHKSHGYKKPLNETADNSLDVNEGEMNIVKKTINTILRKNGIKKSVPIGFSRTSNGYEHNGHGSLSLYGMSEDTVNDLANQMRAAGVKVGMVFNNGFEYNSRELNTSDESINELDDKEIGIVRGNPDFKTQTGRPVGDYVNKRAAANQFQQDFKKEFPDPGVETTPYWMKDRPNSDGDSELDLDIRNSARQATREFGKKLEKDTISQDREERIKLRRRIASLMSHREEFGGDDELDNLIGRLRSQSGELNENE
jgi:Spy/CpxP family protein refolding chaperone